MTILGTQGSVPREKGTMMLVSADAIAGTIGGGRLELEAILRARSRLSTGNDGLMTARFPLGPSLGQCCGGTVDLEFRPLTDADLAHIKMQECGVLTPLLLFGAGHVGRALAHVLVDLPFDVTWIDERDDAFPQEAGANVRKVTTDTPEAEIAAAGPGACFLVMTHSHALDETLCDAILRRGDFMYCGVIGSATKRARFERRLRDRGVAGDAIARMRCPIGMPAIKGKEPAIIAVAVAAELLMIRNQGDAREY